MLSMIFLMALSGIAGMFGLVALKAGAQYRFRGKTGLLVEGLGLLGCATYGVLGALFAASILPGVLVAGGGIAVALGIRSIRGNDQRYIE